jgi:hypothetical protein
MTQRGVPRSGLWSGGKDCVERNGSERSQVASVAERKPPARKKAIIGNAGDRGDAIAAPPMGRRIM